MNVEKRIKALEKKIEKNNIYIAKVPFSKAQVFGILVSLSLGLRNYILQTGISLPLDFGGNMESLEMEWINPEYLFMVFLIWPLGIFLKHRVPKLSNGNIPRVLLAAAIVGCALWGFKISPYIGIDRWFDAILRQGIVQGFFVSTAAAGLYDIKHGGTKNKIKREEVK